MWHTEETCDLADFIPLVSSRTDVKDLLFAQSVENKVPVYDCQHLRCAIKSFEGKRDVMSELASVLMDGSGIFVMKNAFVDCQPIDEATVCFKEVIERERGVDAGGDHFAKPGANDRIWNALEKLCIASPSTFARYYANDMLALASEAWLGPAYQVTSQINVVHPGGAAQQPHCDYHLGFQTADVASRYPAHVHQLSRVLTLQGAVSHCHMPIESGPTKVLPHSQTYAAGYVAWRRDDFRAYFEENYVQMALEKGDAMFFNPSLFHAAGANLTRDIERMANLLQVSSPYGIPIETPDRSRMSKLLYPVLADGIKTGKFSTTEIATVIATASYGYPFPTNLDENPPIGGLAPKSQQMLMHDALERGLPNSKLEALLK